MPISDPTSTDVGISATLHHIEPVDKLLSRIKELDRDPITTLVDLGCGTGYLTVRTAEKLGATSLVGVDADEDRLAAAAARGVRTIMADLSSSPIDLESGSADVATSFGVLAYLPLYDNLVSEAARVLRPGGWFVVSLPNLGSYTNRLSLLLGYQPREVEVSAKTPAGIVGFQRRGAANPNLGPHLHAATLRAMRDLLDFNHMDVVDVLPLRPDFGRRAVRIADRIFSVLPSWSRRFAILARRRAD